MSVEAAQSSGYTASCKKERMTTKDPNTPQICHYSLHYLVKYRCQKTSARATNLNQPHVVTMLWKISVMILPVKKTENQSAKK